MLRCDGKIVPLAPKLTEILLALVENHGSLVAKEELMRRVWPDTFVEEGSLTRGISRLRAALGEATNEERYIQTLARRGYCFVAEVRELDEEAASPPQSAGAAEAAALEHAVEEPAAPIVGGAAPESLATERAAPRRVARRAWIGAGIAAALVLAALAYFEADRPSPTPPAGGLRTLAVLPFQMIGAASEDEYLGLGLADALITRLGGLGGVIVRSTNAARRFGGSDADPQEAGRRLGVEAVLEGNLQRQGDHLRLTVQLVDVESGRHLWSHKFDERFTNVFQLEDTISRSLAEALTLELSRADRELLARRSTEDPEAYADYLKGRYQASRLTRDGFELAIQYLRQAIERDPDYARAYEGLAYYYIQANDLLLPSSEAMPLARAAARRALELDESLAAAHASLAMVLWQYDWDWEAAVSQFRRALELNPSSAETHQNFGFCLVMLGRFDEAVEQARQGREQDPLSLETNVHLAAVLYWARRYPEAIAAARHTIQLDPQYWLAHVILGRAHEQLGELARATREYELARGIEDQIAEIEGDLGRVYALAGRTEEARAVLAHLEQPAPQGFVAPYDRATILAALGEIDLAFEALEQAYDGRSWYLSWLKVDPPLDPLRSDPRFTDLLRRVGLAEAL